MNFLKRAIKYCVRQRLRTLLLFLTFTLLSTTVLIAVSSEEAVLQGTKQIEETVGASVRMEIDMNNQNNFGPAEDFGNGASGYTYNGDRITEKMISAISKLPNVVSYNAKIDGGYWGVSENFGADSGHGECTRFVNPLYCSIGFFFRYKIFKWNI